MDAIYDVFLWYLTLASLIMLILAGKFGFSEITKNILLVCTLVGMLGIVAFGARDAETLVGRIGGGIYSLYGITSYIGDFVSYLRLMALGLAGGFIKNNSGQIFLNGEDISSLNPEDPKKSFKLYLQKDLT